MKCQCGASTKNGASTSQDSSTLATKVQDQPAPAPSVQGPPALCHPMCKAQQHCHPKTDVAAAGLYPVLKGEVCLSREPLEIHNFKEMESSYSEVTSTFTAYSRSQCLYTNVDDDIDSLDDHLKNGYSV